MKDGWIDYPLGIFIAAIHTAVGSILALVISMCLGTWIAFWCTDGVFGSVMVVLPYTIGIIGVSIAKVWGVMYLGFVIWMIHAALIEDKSLVIVCFSAIVLQTAIALQARQQLLWTDAYGMEELRKISIVFASYCVLYVIGKWMIWRRAERSRTSNNPVQVTG